jgi:3',5'-cyclic AMP phosphodiesterase CpdA
MNINILHLTDFHLNDFAGTSEFLRNKFYQEYIDDLAKCIKSDKLDIDFIVLTGDFVDKGKVENFEHLGTIVKYLCDKLDVSLGKVCVTIGNHDYKWKEENGDFSKSSDFRKPFYDFADNYGLGVTRKSDRYFLKRLEDNVFFLSLDSTLKSTSGKPGKLENSEIDELIADVLKPICTKETLLLIGCHFPIVSIPNNLLASEEEGWHDNHVWIGASHLQERISNIETFSTIWFHGDVHAGDSIIKENSIFLLTGRFGVTIESASQLPRQAKIVSFKDNTPWAYTYSYLFETHTQNPNGGKWSSSKGVKIRTIVETNPNIALPIVGVSQSRVQVIDNEIEDAIISDIENRELFRFGRFKTNQNYSSLGWINISTLMNNAELLSRILEKALKYIKTTVAATPEESIIIGLELIGGIVASQMSVQTTIKNYGIIKNLGYHIFNISLK